MDVFSLELAIYFIAPPVALCVAAYVFGLVLTLVCRPVVKREVSVDTAMHAMATVIASTAGVMVLIEWTTQVRWLTMAGGFALFFVVGAIVYSRFIKDFSPRDRKGFVSPIGLWKGTVISAILSTCAVACTLFALWCTGSLF